MEWALESPGPALQFSGGEGKLRGLGKVVGAGEGAGSQGAAAAPVSRGMTVPLSPATPPPPPPPGARRSPGGGGGGETVTK